MKIRFRLHPDKVSLFLCIVGVALLLVYHKMLGDRGLLKTKRFKEKELLVVLEYQQPSGDSEEDSALRVADDRRSLSIRSANQQRSEQIVSSKHVNRNKYLIYLCNRQKLCGNWETRQVGIINTFILANLTKRIFKVSMTSPCKLQKYLVPKEYNWIPDINELRGKSFEVINDRNVTFLKNLQTEDFNLVYEHDTIFIRATSPDFLDVIKQNPLYKDMLSEWMSQKNNLVFRDTWNMIMTTSTYTKGLLDDIIKKHSIPSFGELLCVYINIENDTTASSKPYQHIFHFLEPFTAKSAKIFTSTNSEEFRNVTRTKLGDKVLDSGGAVLNIDKDRGYWHSCLGLQTVILDQLILSQCYVLVASKSSFGDMATVLKGPSPHVFTFNKGTVYPYTHAYSKIVKSRM